MVYGFVHGVGPDHLAALATLLCGDGGRRRALGACVRFGVGHALVLGGLAAGSALAGWWIPEAWEQAAEATGGALLVVLGGLALFRALHIVVHRHPHAHDGHAHDHWHMHLGDPRRHRHGHAALWGGLLALSGVRALAIAVSPLLLAGRSLRTALAFLLAFGLGVTLSMIAFGVLFHLGRARLGAGGRHLATMGVGSGSVVLGCWWIWSSLI
jgi:hypothetical protein